MTDVLNRLSALVAELQTIGCDVAVARADITVTINYPSVQSVLDEVSPQRIVEETAADPPPAPAKQRVTETRKPKRKGGAVPPVDYAEVARVAREAPAGQMISAVAAHFAIAQGAASMRIRKARMNGHDIPSPNSGMGPIERRAFDAEQARDGAADGVARHDQAVLQHDYGLHGHGTAPKPAPADPGRTPLTDIAHLEALADRSIDRDGDDG